MSNHTKAYSTRLGLEDILDSKIIDLLDKIDDAMDDNNTSSTWIADAVRLRFVLEKHAPAFFINRYFKMGLNEAPGELLGADGELPSVAAEEIAGESLEEELEASGALLGADEELSSVVAEEIAGESLGEELEAPGALLGADGELSSVVAEEIAGESLGEELKAPGALLGADEELSSVAVEEVEIMGPFINKMAESIHQFKNLECEEG